MILMTKELRHTLYMQENRKWGFYITQLGSAAMFVYLIFYKAVCGCLFNADMLNVFSLLILWYLIAVFLFVAFQKSLNTYK
jgi:uncharacterized membrane protein